MKQAMDHMSFVEWLSGKRSVTLFKLLGGSRSTKLTSNLNMLADMMPLSEYLMALILLIPTIFHPFPSEIDLDKSSYIWGLESSQDLPSHNRIQYN